MSFTASSGAPFVLNDRVQILVDPLVQHAGPLLSFAQTFHSDLVSLTGFNDINQVTVGSPSGSRPVIFLSAGSKSNHTFFNGQKTGEGYDFDISNTTYTIRGVDPIGTWWGTCDQLCRFRFMTRSFQGTRTLLQQAALARAGGSSTSISISTGSGSDTPGWEVRGFMLDTGRHWFRPSFLGEAYLSRSLL